MPRATIIRPPRSGDAGAGALLAFLLAAVTVRIPILLAGSDVRFSLLADDAFYYMEAARRTLESGAWPSMDGANPTNGFHPLYMLIQLGLSRMMGGDPAMMVGTVLAINLMLNTISALVLFSSLGSRSSGTTAVIAGLLVGLSPGWMAHGFAGVENSLSSLLLLLLALRWRDALAPATTGGPRSVARDAADGCLAGLAMLARTDAALFIGLGILVIAAVRARRHGARAPLLGGVVCAAVAGAIVVPWLGASVLEIGTIAQDSGMAIAARTARLAGEVGSPTWFRTIATNLAFWGYRLSWMWGLVPLTSWLLGMQVPWNRLRMRGGWGNRMVALLPVLCGAAVLLRGNDLWYIDKPATAGLEMLLVGIAGFGGLLTPRETTPRWSAWKLLVGLWMVVTVVLYSAGLKAFQVWYSTGPSLVAIGLATLPPFAELARRHRRLVIVLLALLGVQAALKVHDYRTRAGFEGLMRNAFEEGVHRRGRLLALAPLGGRNEPRIGSFDSGRLSYVVHPYPIMNLDGVMNHEGSRALVERRFAEYLRVRGVEFIISPLTRIAEFQALSPFQVEADSGFTRSLGMPVFRVVDSSGAGPGAFERRAGGEPGTRSVSVDDNAGGEPR